MQRNRARSTCIPTRLKTRRDARANVPARAVAGLLAALASAPAHGQGCGPNLATNPSGQGYPSPLESDRGWGGGARPWEIVDGPRTYYESWAHGLAFTGGNNNWDGEPCGWRQATIDFGAERTLNKIVIWHHGHDSAPAEATVSYYGGDKEWHDITAQRTFGRIEAGGQGSTSDEYKFAAVSASKVRFGFDNCGDNVLGEPITHGWIYEFEVFLMCDGDFNSDCTVSTQDVLDFLNAWNAQEGSTDMNGDAAINTIDVVAFLNMWNAPC
ncbi:MAG TPA: GC-type dockerin domain-anchored protein [Phycisphaerales bacterium]|nr:GC-type dockerin domain-anchored protein [Phycisphaerales bacterium]